MVQAVLVKDGQSVRAGDVLLRVDPLQSQASADLFRNQLDAALVLEARLIADQAGQMAERRATLRGQLALVEAAAHPNVGLVGVSDQAHPVHDPYHHT